MFAYFLGYDERMNNDYWVGAHTKHRLLYHFTFIPKYRKRILRFQVEKRLRELFYECAEANDWYIHQLEILNDHVHLLVQLTTKDSPASAMHYLKSGSSKVIRNEFPEIRAFLWGDSFWADGYFVETIGKKNEQAIKAYLNSHHSKHRS